MQFEDVLVVYCDTHQDADQLKFHIGLECIPIEPEHPGLLVVSEHRIVGVEQLTDKQLEKLLLHATLIDCGFPDEFNAQWFP